MKKISIVSSFAFAFLAVASIVAYLLRFVPSTQWVSLVIGVLLLIISGILAAFAEKSIPFNAVCSMISAVALGFLIRAWYINREFDNSLWMMLLVSLAAVAYLWLFFIITRIPLLKRHPKLVAVLFTLVSFLAYIGVVSTTVTTFVSTFGYYMLVVLAFIFAMCKSTSDSLALVRALTLSTYSLFAVALIVAIMMILGDGDFDFDLDFDLDFGDAIGEGAAEFVLDSAEAVISTKDDRKNI